MPPQLASILEGVQVPSAAQAPVRVPVSDDMEEGMPNGTRSPAVEAAPPEDIVQVEMEDEDPLSSSLSSPPSAEDGDGTSAGTVTAGYKTHLKVPRPARSAADHPPTARDAVALKALARLRVKSYAQLRATEFPGHPSLVGRRMQRLAKLGWVALHMDRLTDGGHPIYAFPTLKTMRWARKQFLTESAGTAHELLVKTMLPNVASTFYTPEPRTAPAFLRHQELTNDLAAAIEQDPRNGIQWLSTWSRPFPHALHGLALPQPDLVFVANVNGAPQLFFGEFDRNSNESVMHFAERKAKRARALSWSSVLPELTGFRAFRMLIVVADKKDPIGRIRKLMEATTKAGRAPCSPSHSRRGCCAIPPARSGLIASPLRMIHSSPTSTEI